MRAIDHAVLSRETARVVRLTIDIRRPIPVSDVVIVVRLIHRGRRTELISAELLADDRIVLSLAALRVIAVATPEVTECMVANTPAVPARSSTLDWPDAHTEGYLSATECRPVRGSPGRSGPASAWARARIPLVADQPTTGLQHLLILADSTSGVSARLNLRTWTFPNADLTLMLTRNPAFGWIYLDA